MKKYRIVYLVSTILILLCGLFGGVKSAPVILAVMAVLPILSGAGFYISLRGISLSLEGGGFCRSGQDMNIKLILKCPRPCAVGNIKADIVCRNNVFNTEKEMPYMLELGRGRRHEYSVPLDTNICGLRTIKIREMICYDFLGLFSHIKPLREEVTCIVYPYEAKMYVEFRKNTEREQPGDIYDGKKSGTDVSEVFGLREYAEGDSLQSIHWKLSGKMNKLIVREFGRPVNYHTLVLLSPSFLYSSIEVEEKTVNGVFDLGVSLSHALLNQNIAHFVGCFDGGEIHCIPVDSPASYENMLINLMNRPLQKNGDDTMIAFIDRQMHRQYTKVLYVAGGINEKIAQNLSEMIDLTVIQAAEGGSVHFAGGRAYESVGIPIENIRKAEYVIPL
ncbi:MAG: DUF58 domain-containing protein [Firmicutes bacterium]|nr:DUF58 domain-containing protein [Bacillota bacterium]